MAPPLAEEVGPKILPMEMGDGAGTPLVEIVPAAAGITPPPAPATSPNGAHALSGQWSLSYGAL